jgi:uncharacterized membrane protein
MNKVTRRLVIALAVSASINLFLIGFVTARFALQSDRMKPFGDEASRPGPVSLFGATEVLGNSKPMKRLLLKHMKDFEPKRKELREARDRISQALAAEPFDPKLLSKELGNLRQATRDSQRAIHNALVDLAISLTPEERRMLSKSPRLWRGEKGRRPLRRRGESPDL